MRRSSENPDQAGGEGARDQRARAHGVGVRRCVRARRSRRAPARARRRLAAGAVRACCCRRFRRSACRSARSRTSAPAQYCRRLDLRAEARVRAAFVYPNSRREVIAEVRRGNGPRLAAARRDVPAGARDRGRVPRPATDAAAAAGAALEGRVEPSRADDSVRAARDRRRVHAARRGGAAARGAAPTAARRRHELRAEPDLAACVAGAAATASLVARRCGADRLLRRVADVGARRADGTSGEARRDAAAADRRPLLHACARAAERAAARRRRWQGSRARLRDRRARGRAARRRRRLRDDAAQPRGRATPRERQRAPEHPDDGAPRPLRARRLSSSSRSAATSSRTAPRAAA